MENFISIGITGGIGSGKSYVCRIVEAMGYPVFYSDQEAKEIISTDPEARKALIALFGDNTYAGALLNRSFLADQIFKNPDLREKMNNIVHPLVRKKFARWAQQANASLVFNEAAILFETGAYKNFNKTVLVTAPEEIRLARVVQRDGIPIKDIKARMDAQWPDEKKIPLADYVINNDGKQPLLPQIVQMIESLQ